MNETETKKNLRNWILSRAREHGGSKQLTNETPLVESGFLSSLDIVEFVLYVESLRGDEIDVDELEPEVFTSIDTMYRTFFIEDAA